MFNALWPMIVYGPWTIYPQNKPFLFINTTVKFSPVNLSLCIISWPSPSSSSSPWNPWICRYAISSSVIRKPKQKNSEPNQTTIKNETWSYIKAFKAKWKNCEKKKNLNISLSDAYRPNLFRLTRNKNSIPKLIP